MDTHTLKLELIERIAKLEDGSRLLALKRLLDMPVGQASGPPTYTAPSDHLSIVREGEASYLKLEDRDYSAAEVRALLEKVLHEVEADQENYASHFTPEEWDAMDREREEVARGEGTFYTIEEVITHLKEDLGK
ncbi:MAG: hypothetical protein ACOH13_08185 [Flavobacteriales bacterium]